MKIGYLRVGFTPEALRDEYGEYLEMYTEMFRLFLPAVELHCYEVRDGEMPTDPAECDAWICCGSADSVYDDLPWIAPLKQFVRDLYEAGGRMVGICFGHQLIAEALGGKVDRAKSGWGIGIHEVRLSGARKWMTPFRSKYNLLYSHQDQVVQLPKGANLLGSSDHCPNAIYTVDGRFLGIQGHPEFDRPYTKALILSRADRIDAGTIEAALKSLYMDLHREDLFLWLGRFLVATQAVPVAVVEPEESCGSEVFRALAGVV
ncbi:MAG: hypothetical protein HQL53_09840 [Magnetococcales bacterium]|nr:hypothetical protein [Magnetococcales bacterium]